MTPSEFRAWRARLGLTQTEAARELELTPRMVKMYEKGAHPTRRDVRGAPAPVIIPRVVELACAALEIGPLSLQRRKRESG